MKAICVKAPCFQFSRKPEKIEWAYILETGQDLFNPYRTNVENKVSS